MKIQDLEHHRQKLKERFAHYETISVDDFYDFYTDVFGDIKKSTLHWYIYELKNHSIIQNVSRGLYKISDAGEQLLNEYIAVTMDVIDSTKREDRNVFNDMLKNKTDQINDIILNKLEIHRRFHISQGDEIQILFPQSQKLGDLLLITLSHLYPFKVRYGISFGKVQGELLENSWDMNGPIFWNARDQIEKKKKSNKYDGLVISGNAEIDRVCNNILPIVNKAIHMITEKQWEAIRESYVHSDIGLILDRLGIVQASYYERIQSSNKEEILLSFQSIFELLKWDKV